jgi:hypothetical protein
MLQSATIRGKQVGEKCISGIIGIRVFSFFHHHLSEAHVNLQTGN